jgi:hypothetical protein
LGENILLEYLSGFGLGAVVVVLIQNLLNFYQEKRTRTFNEKKEAYVGLLEALHQASVESTLAAQKNFGYWQIRCELVSNTEIRQVIQNLVDTSDDKEARSIAYETLKRLLRKDLGISD